MGRLKVTRPLIDVIVPVYNGEQYIPNFLEQMKKQKSGRLRFVFVDDGSEDRSRELLSDAANNSGLPIKVILPEHAGVGAARNRGIEASDADYITFFDVDDICSPDYAENLVREAEHGGFDVLIFNRKSLADPTLTVPETAETESESVSKEEQLKAVLFDDTRYGGVYNLLLDRLFVERAELRFAEGYPYYEDGNFLYRALAHAEKIRRLDCWLYGYIAQRGGSAMARFTPERLRCLGLLKALEPEFDAVPEFSALFRRYGVSRIYWSVLWQAALVSPSETAFLRFAENTWASDYMRLLHGFPDRKVFILRKLYLTSKRLYYRTSRLLGRRYTLLGKVSPEVLDEAARLCPKP